MNRVESILFVVNHTKPGAVQIAADLANEVKRRGIRSEQTSDFPLPPNALADFDLCFVIGGDGSILGVVEAATENDVPVIGVNLGTLGFMANFSTEEIFDALPQILEGKVAVSPRKLLLCKSRSGETRLALNDLVIKAHTSRLVRLIVSSQGERVNEYHADGLIIATSTGSTAYNLSAGGPILHPAAKAIVLNPINPHSLTARAIVLDDRAVLQIAIEQRHPNVQVSADGVEIFREATDFPIEVSVCQDRAIKLVQHIDYSHFKVLRTKLRWTGDTPTRLQS